MKKISLHVLSLFSYVEPPIRWCYYVIHEGHVCFSTEILAPEVPPQAGKGTQMHYPAGNREGRRETVNFREFDEMQETRRILRDRACFFSFYSLSPRPTGRKCAATFSTFVLRRYSPLWGQVISPFFFLILLFFTVARERNWNESFFRRAAPQ